VPLIYRKQRLAKLLGKSDPAIRSPDEHLDDGANFSTMPHPVSPNRLFLARFTTPAQLSGGRGVIMGWK
jgi:hypothetical protein